MQLSVTTRRQLGYAQGYLMLGMKRDALAALDEIAGDEAEATPVLQLLATACVELAEWGRAAGAAGILCEREPGEAGHWIQCAYATRRARDLASARHILMRGLARHPLDGTIHFNLACYAAQRGDLVEAREFLASACLIDEAFAEMAKTDPDLEPLRAD